MLTLEQRAASYAKAFPECPGSVWVAGGPERRWLYGHWAIGNTYKNDTLYYGAFPRGFLDRLRALFPDMPNRQTLHVFSGSLMPGSYTRLDINPDLRPDICGSVYDIGSLTQRRFKFAIADPPYTSADAEKYSTRMISRSRATRTLADVVVPGGHLAWLDCVWPMFSKELWHYYGSITVVRSTNHRVRVLSLFERRSPGG